jgi:Predicted esterase of the alpha/beta hydrolase fold
MQYLNIPGLYNSGELHWQTRWEQLYPANFSRVQQACWDQPVKEEWVSALNHAIQQLDAPTILVAHSLGCITAVHWAASYATPFVKGALLVAPADVERSSRDYIKTFAPVPLQPLSIPSVVVASMNDPHCAIDRAAKWAAYWRSRFVSVGNLGHINSDSNIHGWPEGMAILQELENTIGVRQYSAAC